MKSEALLSLLSLTCVACFSNADCGEACFGSDDVPVSLLQVGGSKKAPLPDAMAKDHDSAERLPFAFLALSYETLHRVVTRIESGAVSNTEAMTTAAGLLCGILVMSVCLAMALKGGSTEPDPSGASGASEDKPLNQGQPAEASTTKKKSNCC
mmetsp:Transcript_77780/g.137174  ORF Transcript_77780/g.137174 Transcript_77780/m.137174 type:complete len:153 (+) Transcript_77780:58-516(+)